MIASAKKGIKRAYDVSIRNEKIGPEGTAVSRRADINTFMLTLIKN